MNQKPTFILFGQPNDGKTSLVSALTQNPNLAISEVSGNTTRNRKEELIGEIAFIDTPGFGMVEEVYEWMRNQEDCETAPQGVLARRFVNEFKHDDDFSHEVELMKVLSEPVAAILVVDPSRPIDEDDKLINHILRYCGNTRIALMNAKSKQPAHINEWSSLLKKDFNTVREFNALSYKFNDIIRFLVAIKSCEQRWENSMDCAIQKLEQKRSHLKVAQSHATIQFIKELLCVEASVPIKSYDSVESSKAVLKVQLQKIIASKESQYQKKSCKRFNVRFEDINADFVTSINNFTTISKEASWSYSLFGVDDDTMKWIRTTMGAATGAMIGGTIDAFLGGASMLVGLALGTVIGGVAGYLYEPGNWSFKEDKDKKCYAAQLNIDEEYFIIIDKLIHYAMLAMSRTHTNREKQILSRKDLNINFTQSNYALLRDFALAVRHEKVDKEIAYRAQLLEELNSYFSKF